MTYLYKAVAISILLLIPKTIFAGIVVLNGLTHHLSGRSGEVLYGKIEIYNASNFPEKVNFELNEAIFSCEGTRVFTSENSHERSSLNWFDASLMSLELAPNEQYTYTYSIKIPEKVYRDGSYWNMLMITSENPEKTQNLSADIGLDTQIRFAVGIITHVNSNQQVDLSFENIGVTKGENTEEKTLEVKVKNEGEFLEGVLLTLEIFHENGEKLAELNTQKLKVFPSNCKQYKIKLPPLENGEYSCLLVANSKETFIATNLSISIN